MREARLRFVKVTIEHFEIDVLVGQDSEEVLETKAQYAVQDNPTSYKTAEETVLWKLESARII